MLQTLEFIFCTKNSTNSKFNIEKINFVEQLEKEDERWLHIRFYKWKNIIT